MNRFLAISISVLFFCNGQAHTPLQNENRSGESNRTKCLTFISGTEIAGVVGNQTTDYSLQLQKAYAENNVLAVMGKTINISDTIISDLPLGLKIFRLRSSIIVSQSASFKLKNKSGLPVNEMNDVTDNLQIVVTAETGESKTYSISVGTSEIETLDVSESTDMMEYVGPFNYNLSGRIYWEIEDKTSPFRGSLLNIQSEDVWMLFSQIRPSEFKSKFLKHILINGATAVEGVNIRIVQYIEGTMVISHPSDYQPLEVFTEEQFGGASKKLGQYTFYKSAELGSFDNAIRSFKLKRGYMATFGRDENGKAYSRVYIADLEDIDIDSLPDGLYDEVSYIRVFPWRWVGKKAWRGDDILGDIMGCTSRYDYNTDGESSLDIEYVPMWHNTWWNQAQNMPDRGEYTHYLGFNEPDHEEQANMTVDKCIELWPQLMEKGLRLGSPVATDMNYLNEFIDRCDSLDYRVDFVALHCYQSNQTVQKYWDFLNNVHKRTGRPLWITEWNNGCNWTYDATHPVPSYEQNKVKIAAFTHMLDTASFVERYFVWDGCNETLRMTYSGTNNLTPAGLAYQEQVSSMAFNHEYEFVKEFLPYPEKATLVYPAYNTRVRLDNTVMKWTPGNYAKSHEVFLGTSFFEQSSRGKVTQSSFDPGQLQPDTRYYWRIDEINGSKVTKGDVWTFASGDSITGSRPVEFLDISVHPGIGSDRLYIKGLKELVDVNIVNMLGQVVHQEKKNSGEISVAHLPEGVYVIQINRAVSLKFVIKR